MQKGLAIIAVVAIHSFSTSINSPVSLFVDQLSRFSVPLFVALSGFGLTKSFEKNSNLLNYYFRRVWKILPLFIIASVTILIYKNIYENGSFDFLNYKTWTMMLRGYADYHLYFVPMILKFYLIFPVLFFVVKKLPLPALVAALLWQGYLYYRITAGTEIPGNSNQIWPDQMQYLAPETWIYYFILGVFLAFKQLTPKHYLLTAIVLFGFLLTFGNAYILQHTGIDSLVATRFTRLPVILYATGIILLGLTANPYPLTSILSILGKHSYPIYLFHTIVLRLLPAASGFVLTPAVLILTLIPFAVLDKIKAKIYK